ncbi:MAG TPA: alpha-amylase family glycosyl hydrolase [Candidatus Acidoferrum sp.]|nr:alpha-amylase family glycosyl hydrolase [Candidatus Acidoferrum sp.]
MIRGLARLILVAGMAIGALLHAQESANLDAPAVKKIEPPNWWVGLTPDVMLLLSGKNLRATRVSCNLRDVVVSRTQSSGDGSYLFVWLKLGPDLRTGTAVCRITTAHGETTFELPIAARQQILGRNQGITLDDVIYLIMPDRFANGDPLNDEPAEFPGSHDRSKPRAWHGGDLRGIEQHLDYLKDLGVTTLWLTPVVKNGGTQDYHGYGAVDLYAVDPHLGTLADYQKLILAAHKQHMKVLFDVVPNHVGPRHPWAANPPLPDWFHGTPANHLTAASPLKGSFYGLPEKKEITNDAFESLVDPHTPPQLRRSLTEGWFAGILPDMNTENPIVAEYLAQNSIWWAETTGLDGYRIDTFPYVSREFWRQWHTALRRIYPRLSTIGEVFHPDPTVASFYQGGRKGWDGIDTQLTAPFDYPLYFTLRDVLLKGAPAGKLANILREDSLYPHPEFLVPFFGNHDTTRLSEPPEGTPGRLKLAFGLVFTVRGIPEMYYGDEIGLPGGRDPDNRRDFPGGWTEDERNAFQKDGRTREQEELHEFVRGLLQVRSQHPALRRGKLWSLASDDTSYIFLRETDEERIVVAFHKGAGAREITVPFEDSPGHAATNATVLFGPGQAELAGRAMKLRVPGQSLTVFLLQ